MSPSCCLGLPHAWPLGASAPARSAQTEVGAEARNQPGSCRNSFQGVGGRGAPRRLTPTLGVVPPPSQPRGFLRRLPLAPGVKATFK